MRARRGGPELKASENLLIDLHTHSAAYSTCSSLTVEELVAGSRARGFDAICLSEHDKLWPKEEVALLARRLGFPIFRAMELSAAGGHVLVFGLEDYGAPIYSLRRLREIADAVGAAIVKSHPLRDMAPPAGAGSLVEYLGLFDALEVFSGGESEESNRRALALARDHSIPATGGGDVHAPSEIGRFATRFERWITDERMLAAEIRAGRVQPYASPR